ncbi:MAG: DUF4845 domain-containing protein [Lysobacteraceae bacterium]|nr:MAG: DUF4845 domain-containing protein [Xanthomonadaceae bacterium]
MLKNQRGLTLIGFLVVLAIVGFFIFIGMRLFPVYQEYYAVSSAMNAMQQEPGVAAMQPQRVEELLFRKFYISYVDSVRREDVNFSRKGGYKMRVKYEVRENLIANLDFVAKFEKTVSLDGR